VPKVSIDGDALEYVERGSGPPLVLVHGSASDYRTWKSQQDAFSTHFRTISYRRRWHWPNRQIPEGVDYSMRRHVDDLIQLIHSLDAGPAHLVSSLVLAEPPLVTLYVGSGPKPVELLTLLVTRPRTAAAILKFGALGVSPARNASRRGDMETGVRIFAEAVFGPGGYDRLPDTHKEASARQSLECASKGPRYGIRAP
jgi:non-heme chloroperoxidase